MAQEPKRTATNFIGAASCGVFMNAADRTGGAAHGSIQANRGFKNPTGAQSASARCRGGAKAGNGGSHTSFYQVVVRTGHCGGVATFSSFNNGNDRESMNKILTFSQAIAGYMDLFIEEG